MKYTIRSKAKIFPDFEHEDSEMGYLDFHLTGYVIPKLVAEMKECSPQVKIMIRLCRWWYPTEDILVRPQGSRTWFEIKFRKNSSVSFLKSKTGRELKLHPCDDDK